MYESLLEELEGITLTTARRCFAVQGVVDRARELGLRELMRRGQEILAVDDLVLRWKLSCEDGVQNGKRRKAGRAVRDAVRAHMLLQELVAEVLEHQSPAIAGYVLEPVIRQVHRVLEFRERAGRASLTERPARSFAPLST